MSLQVNPFFWRQGIDIVQWSSLQLYKQTPLSAHIYYYIIQMTEVKNNLELLKGWRTEESKNITMALQQLSSLKAPPEDQLETITTHLADFHKDIGKAKDDEIETTWFELVIALKKKLKKMQELQREKAKKAEKEKKIPTIVEYPAALCHGRRQEDQQILKSLYRNFVTNFEEATKSHQTVIFLQYVLKELKYMFEQKTQQAYSKRINSICHRLSRPSSAEAKGKMLAGDITPLQLAKDNQETYFDQKAREIIRKNQLAQLEESQTGFYDSMKKAINKDACEECRYCHQHRAFCEDMKQIRASDQPMTRFMRCNACNKAWRD